MIGIVFVSHSAKLAEGVHELASQMTQGQVPMAVAGGVDDPANPFGTDPTKILQAIETVYTEEGVLVLLDLGSALLSAEMALEFLPEEQRAKIRLCSAPLVEGAMAAATQALVTSDMDQIVAEAQGALAAKREHLQDTPTSPAPAPAVEQASGREIRLVIANRLGLHARPAARFVATAARFQAQVTVRNITKNSASVNAKSINQVATLGARQGHEIAVTAEGPGADEALAALAALVAANFGEEAAELPPAETKPAAPRVLPLEGELVGIPVSPGIALGPVARLQAHLIELPDQATTQPQAEWERLEGAVAKAKEEIRALHTQAMTQMGSQNAAIFEAHLLFLEDPALIEATRQKIFERSVSAETAWQATIKAMVATYQALEDTYLQARANDVTDVGQRVLRQLTGRSGTALQLSQPSVLVATDLTPSDTAQLDRNLVLGICTEQGSATSHSAILARALGIPAVVGVGPALSRVTEGSLLALDGGQGRVWVRPEASKAAELQRRREAWLAQQQALKAAGQRPAVTQDEHQVEIVANVGSVADVQAALENGAEGVGLLRTEFLYLNRLTAPSEEEQLAVYQAMAAPLGQRPLVIRTLDIGGDKPLPYLNLETEANPFLGWRGIRFCLDHPEIFKPQLRAILRASAGHQFKLMFPMISTLAEVKAAKALLAEVQAELRQEGLPFDEAMEVGIMIEVPAAVLIADQLAAEVDFFSIGTNDLSQYAAAADRTNAHVAALADTFHPAILRLINQTIKAGHEAGLWVGLCGEFAGNPLAVPILLGLGLDEFSMSPPAIPAVKALISQLTMTQAKVVAEVVLALDSAEAVRDYVAGQIANIQAP